MTGTSVHMPESRREVPYWDYENLHKQLSTHGNFNKDYPECPARDDKKPFGLRYLLGDVVGWFKASSPDFNVRQAETSIYLLTYYADQMVDIYVFTPYITRDDKLKYIFGQIGTRQTTTQDHMNVLAVINCAEEDMCFPVIKLGEIYNFETIISDRVAARVHPGIGGVGDLWAKKKHGKYDFSVPGTNRSGEYHYEGINPKRFDINNIDSIKTALFSGSLVGTFNKGWDKTAAEVGVIATGTEAEPVGRGRSMKVTDFSKIYYPMYRGYDNNNRSMHITNESRKINLLDILNLCMQICNDKEHYLIYRSSLWNITDKLSRNIKKLCKPERDLPMANRLGYIRSEKFSPPTWCADNGTKVLRVDFQSAINDVERAHAHSNALNGNAAADAEAEIAVLRQQLAEAQAREQGMQMPHHGHDNPHMTPHNQTRGPRTPEREPPPHRAVSPVRPSYRGLSPEHNPRNSGPFKFPGWCRLQSEMHY